MRSIRAPRADRRTLAALPFLLLALGLLAGCGSDSASDSSGTTVPASNATTSTTPAAPAGATARSCKDVAADLEGLRVTGVDCEAGYSVAAAWLHGEGCASPESASRSACTIRGYRCLGVNAERGLAVSCARSGRSISFIARHD